MILADKIIKLRKKKGWSQEELADVMGVSRQAVSKWESGQTVPDIDKILKLSELFGVTTDYLLKDDLEDEGAEEIDFDDSVRRVSQNEANAYIAHKKKSAWLIAIATLLCILSPITVIILGAASEVESFGISASLAVAVGMAALFGLVICAVAIFIVCGFKDEQYDFLDKNEPFELEYGVKGFVTECKLHFRSTYVKWSIIATCISVLSPIPLILTAFAENDILTVSMLAVLMVTAGIGACIFILIGVRMASMDKLLEQGDYTPEKKSRKGIKSAVGFAYWGITVAVYLTWSFATDNWKSAVITFAIAAILFPVLMSVIDASGNKKFDKM